MVFRSVVFKLVLLVTAAFALTTLSVLLFAQNRVSRIIDSSQQEIYAEKIGVILNLLERTNHRLESTGLVEAYSADFKKSAINLLRETYFNTPNKQVYPTILDWRGRVVMDRTLAAHIPYEPHINLQWPRRATSTPKKYTTFTKGDHWYIYSTFPAWKWFILYSIPLEVKYQETHRLVHALTVIMLAISLTVLFLLSYTLTRFLRPVTELTRRSEEIAKGQLEQPVTIAGSDEFGTLARSFESMRQAVTSQIKELADKEERLRITLDSIGDCVIATDTLGRITKINTAACKLTGWAPEEALGKDIEQVMVFSEDGEDEDSSKIENPVRTVLQTVAPVAFSHEKHLVTKDGTKRLVTDSAAPIRLSHDETIGVVTVFRDVTREKALQEQLQHSQRMDAIGQLAGGVAHDFNNMLAGITGAVDLLEITLPDDHQALKYTDIIRTATERASGLTRRLLDFSRKGKQISIPVNLHTVIYDAISILERSIDKQISIKTDLRAAQSIVIGDPSQLQSGILNICINARDAMPDGGEIFISTVNAEFDETFCSINQDLTPGNFIQLSIQDTGPGIPPEIASHVFEPFYTTKAVGKGTGLGLAAVYGMVKDHHGNITLYSEPGKGAVFHLYLPIAADTEGPLEQQAKPAAVHGSGVILVIDDEDIIRATASLLLENLGYTVLLAENGERGVKRYSQEAENIDLVILDMIMPVMDGREAFDRILTINPDAKIIISSGYAQNMNMTSRDSRRAAGFLTKPFNQFELSKLIATVLSG